MNLREFFTHLRDFACGDIPDGCPEGSPSLTYGISPAATSQAASAASPSPEERVWGEGNVSISG